MDSHPDIAASFRSDGHGGYTSRNGGGYISCPPCVIARLAEQMGPGTLELPEGYDAFTLEQIQAITGWVDRDVHISARQASELAEIGRQILARHSELNTPLGYFEAQSVTRLVSLVPA